MAFPDELEEAQMPKAEELDRPEDFSDMAFPDEQVEAQTPKGADTQTPPSLDDIFASLMENSPETTEEQEPEGESFSTVDDFFATFDGEELADEEGKLEEAENADEDLRNSTLDDFFASLSESEAAMSGATDSLEDLFGPDPYDSQGESGENDR
jgi:membrane protein involved in colicin uptake